MISRDLKGPRKDWRTYPATRICSPSFWHADGLKATWRSWLARTFCVSFQRLSKCAIKWRPREWHLSTSGFRKPICRPNPNRAALASTKLPLRKKNSHLHTIQTYYITKLKLNELQLKVSLSLNRGQNTAIGKVYLVTNCSDYNFTCLK